MVISVVCYMVQEKCFSNSLLWFRLVFIIHAILFLTPANLSTVLDSTGLHGNRVEAKVVQFLLYVYFLLIKCKDIQTLSHTHTHTSQTLNCFLLVSAFRHLLLHVVCVSDKRGLVEPGPRDQSLQSPHLSPGNRHRGEPVTVPAYRRGKSLSPWWKSAAVTVIAGS